MTVRYYSSLDSGAPVVPASASLQVAARTILMACLVNGYGSKPAAGWSVVHDVTNGFSLSNGDGVIAFVYSAISVSVVYIMESITDGSTAFPTGVNRRSGPWFDGSSSTERQYLMIPGIAGATTWYWSVVADDKTVHLSIYISAGYSSNLSFGKFIGVGGLEGPACFGAFGGAQVSRGTAYWGSPQSPGAFVGTMLRNPWTGLIDQGSAPRYGAFVPNVCALASSSSRYATQQDQLVKQPLPLLGYGPLISNGSSYSAAVYAGRLRGAVADPVLAGMTLANIAAALGVSYSDAYQFRVSAITLPGGKQWVPLVIGMSNMLASFVSLDEVDWP